MANFSRKAKQAQTGGTGNFDQDAWNAWNEYIFSVFKAKEIDRKNGRFRKSKSVIAIVNLIMDFGTPPADDRQWKPKPEHVMPLEGEDYSEYEIAYMKEHEGSDFITTDSWDSKANNGKGGMVKARRQTSPQNPVQEYGFAVDVPSIMVDYSKHPNAPEGAEEDLRPYRISLNGYKFKDRKKIGRHLQFETDFQTGEVSEKNFIRSIAIAAGVDGDLVESEFDIGELAGAVCKFQVTLDLSRGDKVFLNDGASKPSPVEDFEYPDPQDPDEMLVFSAEAQIEKALNTKGLQEFVGVLLNDMEYDDDMLKMLAGDKFNFVARAMESDTFIVTRKKDGEEFELGISYETSDFKVAWDEFSEKRDAEFKKAMKAKKAAAGEEEEEDDSEAIAKAKAAKAAKAQKAAKEKAAKEKREAAAKKAAQESAEQEDTPEPDTDEDDGDDFDDDIPF
jgi:hypothetical protein